MAHIPRTNDDGSPRLNRDGTFTVAYRQVRGGKQLTWRCPSLDLFDRFHGLETAAHTNGVPLQDPDVLFGLTSSQPAAEPEADLRPDGPAAGPTAPTSYSLREWVGTWRDQGPFFRYAGRMRHSRHTQYDNTARVHCADIYDLPMSEVSPEMAIDVVNGFVRCKACVKRAEAAGRTDLTGDMSACLASNSPWDGSCIDDVGNSTHWGRLQQHSSNDSLLRARRIFEIAIRQGQRKRGGDPRCAAIQDNPFEDVQVPLAPRRPTPHDDTRPLEHGELRRLEHAMPDWLEASIMTGAYGLLRPSELLGLDIKNVTYPTEESEGQAQIVLTQVMLQYEGLVQLGKTHIALGVQIMLPPLATEKLIAHIEQHRSNPNPTGCGACAAGVRRDWPRNQANPHGGCCDFSDNAPLWLNPETGKRVPRGSLNDIFTAACVAASIFMGPYRPTPKCLRATGAAALLDLGVPIAQVTRMGRWTNEQTPMRHYYRLRLRVVLDANRAVDAVARAERNLPGGVTATDQERIAVLEATVRRLEAENTELRNDGKMIPPILRVRAGGPAPFTDDEFRAAIAACTWRSEIAGALGYAKLNIVHVKARAAKLGITLPPDPEPRKGS